MKWLVVGLVLLFAWSWRRRPKSWKNVRLSTVFLTAAVVVLLLKGCQYAWEYYSAEEPSPTTPTNKRLVRPELPG